MTDDVATAGAAEIDRRRVLLGVGAAGVAGVLAACGGGDESGGPAGSATQAGDDPSATPDTAASADTGENDETDDDQAADDADDDDAGGEVEDALVATEDVPIGAGVILTEDAVVVTQPSEGEFRAFSITCTHEGCPVNSVEDGLIRCVCHGSRFHIDDGSVANGPATRPLDEVAITVQGGQVARA